MFFINFKTYEEGMGENAAKLCDIIDEIKVNTETPIVPLVSPLDLVILANKHTNVWVQHIDGFGWGAHTGYIPAQAVYNLGAAGTALNHSEHKFNDFESLKTVHNSAKQAGLKTLVFASDLEEFKRVIELTPDYISYEPPEFIGRTDISVATAKPEVINDAANIANTKKIPLIVGAGIHLREDVATSIHLGAAGIAVAKNIVTAHNPKEALLELLRGFGK